METIDTSRNSQQNEDLGSFIVEDPTDDPPVTQSALNNLGVLGEAETLQSNNEVRALFSATAAKVSATTHPHERFICTNEDIRGRIAQVIWDKFQIALDGAIFSELMTGHLIFKSQWSYFAPSGCGRVGCLNAESAAWLDQFTANYKDDSGVRLKAWARGDFGSLHRMYIYVPGCIGPYKDKVMNMLLAQNNLSGKFRVFSFKDVEGTFKAGNKTSGTQLQVGIDEELKTGIRLLDKTLFLGSRTVNATISERRKRPEENSGAGSSHRTPTTKQPKYDLSITPTEEDFWKCSVITRIYS